MTEVLAPNTEAPEPISKCKSLLVVRQYHHKKLYETRFDIDRTNNKWPCPIIWLGHEDRVNLNDEYTLEVSFYDAYQVVQLSIFTDSEVRSWVFMPLFKRRVTLFGYEIEVVAKHRRWNGQVVRYCIHIKAWNAKVDT